ncbi:GNAT family N-acetyltransferase [Paenibacillus thalictri]|uniref:GNAT family N-acetyltransferase n=2 Tax=Paenibacillus thalictri TaxID=2527873 RepID=A0A4Q9DTQ4_9BACL|nr:GNAT family N-acetyltransferase [Paenibacillus thalictri]TBL78923.1 GNAT family N-acetyltransferase [Paenibacillus thalictri]
MIIYDESDITIRTLEVKDQVTLVKWLNDPLVLSYYEGRDRAHDIKMVVAHFYQEEDQAVRCIVELKNKPIGYIQYYELDEQAKQEYGYGDNNDKIYGTDQFIGETHYWNQGIGKTLIKTMLHYLRDELKANRVVMDPQQWNIRAITCYERCGFKKIKELPKHEKHEGELRDCWLMEYSG